MKIQEFEKIKDQFDYDKVLNLNNDNFCKPNKLCEKMIGIQVTPVTNNANFIKNSFNINDNSSAMRKENNVSINKTPSIFGDDNKALTNVIIDNLLMSKTVPNTFRGILKFKDIKIKRKILVSKCSDLSVKVKQSTDCELTEKESRKKDSLHITNCHNNEEKESKIDSISYFNNNLNELKPLNLVKDNIYSKIIRPFTAEEDNCFNRNESDFKEKLNLEKKIYKKISNKKEKFVYNSNNSFIKLKQEM